MELNELEIRRQLKDDFVHYALKCLKIRTKSGSIEPFHLNKAQQYIQFKLEEQKRLTVKVRALILKGRQQGCSTLIGGRFYHQTTHRFGCQAFILTHALDATQNLYKMAHRYHEHCPQLVRPEISTSNAKELIFGKLESGYKIGTAENKSVGRSSTIQLFHGSEVGFWSNADEHAKGIMQAIPDVENTEVILESTANGVGNYFHEMWQKAEAGLSDFIAIFVPWFWQDEYARNVPSDFICTPEETELQLLYGLTKEQIAWRRAKIIDLSVAGQNGEKAFKQEYPCHANEAFQMTGEDTYIQPEIVMHARKADQVERYGAIVIGVDPARFGDDRTSIIRRQGRVAYGLESYAKKDTMEITGIVHNIIKKENPTKVFVDVGGLGAGVVDRLNELGYRDKVVAVNAGVKALDENRFVNKRAEMWGEMRGWLEEVPVKIPDIDSLHADLCSVKYKFDSNTRLSLERKEDLKKRGIRSPDEADALALTFAYPATALIDNTLKEKEVAAKLMSNYNRRKLSRMTSYGKDY
jgi:hypothetical protein